MSASKCAPVDDKDYRVSFRFTGRVAKLTYKLATMQLTSEDNQVIRHALARSGTNGGRQLCFRTRVREH